MLNILGSFFFKLFTIYFLELLENYLCEALCHSSGLFCKRYGTYLFVMVGLEPRPLTGKCSATEPHASLMYRLSLFLM